MTKREITQTSDIRLKSMVFSLVSVVFIFSLIGGCATAPTKESLLPVFYPPLPNPPRIQYLTTFSSEVDVTGPQSSFAEFILGKKPKRDIVKKPYGIAIFGGKIYVVDTRGEGYAVLDLEKKDIKFVRGLGGGKMQKPINITIDRDGTKYITDFSCYHFMRKLCAIGHTLCAQLCNYMHIKISHIEST